MPKIILEVPQESCRGCEYLKEQTVDHNYYGEMSTQHVCKVFDTEIYGYNKCIGCIACLGKSDEVRKYADFLVKKIDQISTVSYFNAIDDFANLVKQYVNKPKAIEQMAEELKAKVAE